MGISLPEAKSGAKIWGDRSYLFPLEKTLQERYLLGHWTATVQPCCLQGFSPLFWEVQGLSYGVSSGFALLCHSFMNGSWMQKLSKERKAISPLYKHVYRLVLHADSLVYHMLLPLSKLYLLIQPFPTLLGLTFSILYRTCVGYNIVLVPFFWYVSPL